MNELPVVSSVPSQKLHEFRDRLYTLEGRKALKYWRCMAGVIIEHAGIESLERGSVKSNEGDAGV